MTNEHGKAAATVASSDEFTRAVEYYLECVRDRTKSIAAFEAAQKAYIDEANALPQPELMTGPVVVVTDADSLEKARAVLEMTTVGIGFQDRIAERMAELIDYRHAKAKLAKKHNLDELGETALLGASMVQRALGLVLKELGEPDTWEAAVRGYQLVQSSWAILGDDYADQEGDALSDIWGEYRERMMQFPAPTPQAFVTKLRVLFTDEDDLRDDAKVVLADAERLFGTEAGQ